jgi:uncharacterized membrane protein HdeD (DUF308 family)
MMNYCWQWMMSFGWIGVVLGLSLVIALIVLGVMLIGWTVGAQRR